MLSYKKIVTLFVFTTWESVLRNNSICYGNKKFKTEFNHGGNPSNKDRLTNYKVIVASVVS